MDGTILADVGDGRQTENAGRRVANLRFDRALADELKDPITAVILYAQTCALWLGADAPNLTEASNAAAGVAKALKRANDLIEGSASASGASAAVLRRRACG